MNNTSQRLKDKILAKRWCRLDVADLKPFDKGYDEATIDSFVGSFGFHGLGDQWRNVQGREAAELLGKWLQKNLASGVEVMSSQEATTFALEFRQMFRPSACCYTNVATGDGVRGGANVTGAAYEAGVVLLDDRQIGWLWFEDED